MPESRGSDPSGSSATLRSKTTDFAGNTSFNSSPGDQGMGREKMSGILIKEKFLSDHRILRCKAAVVATLALDVLRGDDELASALRLKGEELYTYLLKHMQWEERLLLPLLIESSHGTWTGASIVKEHEEQRVQLDNSLAKLRHIDTSLTSLAEECLELVGWLEVDMTTEEARVLRWMAGG